MEGKWGLIPDMTGSVTLRELVPMDVAKRLTMTAEVFDGRQALAYGLVTGVLRRAAEGGRGAGRASCWPAPPTRWR